MASTLIGGLAVAAPAMAQEGAADDDVVVITGSRIQRTDTVAPSPITSVNEELFELNNVVNTEDLLNTLPQLIPAFDATSNNPGDGTATVSLRGLGTSRTLVLVDGTRFVGSGAAQVVDLNNIPAAMVERVDVVTGGASAVYGSDAVAGVVNFILRDDFEGVEVSTSHEFSMDEGDAAISDVSVTLGGNFDNGRGNAVLSFGYTNREAVFQASREFSEVAYWSPGPGTDPYIPGGSSSIPETWIRPAAGNYFDTNPVDSSGDPYFLMTQPGGAIAERQVYNYAPTNYLQLPQERHMISAFATYEINDNIEMYARGIYANNVVDSQLAPTPTGTLTIDVNLDNPLLSTELRDLFANDASSNNGDGTATVRIARRMQEINTRNSLRDTNTFQGVLGFRGDINNDWSYDVFYNYSRSAVSQILSGNISVAAFQEAILCDGGPTAVASGCTAPALDIWNGANSVSAEAADYIARTGAQIDVIEATQAVASVSGELSNMASPMANIAPALVLGVEYRENSASIRPDSVLGPDVRGFNQSLPIEGSFDVYEFFTEVDVPLITDRPGIQSLNFTGAFRMSDYSTVGNTQTYAAGLGWEPVDSLRIRTQYNRAVRAPNVGDLFSPATNGFPGATDPCSGGLGSFDSDVIVANCIASGVPAASVGTPFQSNAQIEALFGGNANVDEEVADTFTIGAVWQPNFISGFTMQVDYYNIEIEDAIATPSLQNLLDECYRQDIQSACAFFAGARNPSTGEMANPYMPELFSSNLAVFEAEGVDVRVDYMWDAEQMGLSPDLGSFSVNYYSTFTIGNGYQTSEVAGFVACEGQFSGQCGEPTPEYKHVAQASWYWGNLTTSLRWRHIGGVDIEPSYAGFVSDRELSIDSYNYFDVTFGYDVSETVRVSLGLQNVMDEEPPVLTSTSSEQANTYPATYDPFGRRLFLGANLRF
ncbi:TonB-dependent receptor plug domain-containing protein [Maricaulis virginensis]|uniref:TonB-dependent receptor n=1 Tax=Maricaulis virginensis TaxID=144022 RepID=A0A9W6IIL4_9PROT|nr:TonB-dependent receptor [Maricaulis virginensis]GLK50898.1 TonB-dependent receptor [Maricaulis virginensis]